MFAEKKAKLVKQLILYIGVAMSLFHIWILGFSPMETWAFRSIHLLFAIVLILLSKPLKLKNQLLVTVIDTVLILASIVCCGYIVRNSQSLVLTIQFKPQPIEVVLCVIGVLLVLEITRRVNGNTMPLLAIFFMAYGWFGQYLPGAIGHKGYSFSRIATYSFSLDGVFGVSLGVAATYMILFVIFGAILEGTGGGRLFIDLATAGFGKYRGGPAKAGILASAGMGMISGSSAGVVVTTGSFTIPLMKKIGYSPTFSGAVTAVASSGGQVMPPVMGAGAFIMAESLGVPYLSIAAAAVIPALFYFLSVFLMVDTEAIRLGLWGIPKDQLPKAREVLKEVGHLLVPLAVLLYFLIVVNATPIKAGLYGIYTSLIIALFRKNTRYNLKQLLDMLCAGARNSVSVISACACAGLVIGMLTLTGLGNKIAGLIIVLSQGNLLIALILSMLVTVLLGMGLPTTAAYIITSSVVAPALADMGVLPICAHMFIFYFACMSSITPPVAIAAYAAAGIADSNPNTTGWAAFRLGLAAFIVPYMFVYTPSLLAQGEIGVILYSTAMAIVGIYFFSAAIAGWLFTKIPIAMRVVMFAGSLCLIHGDILSDVIGVVICAGCVLYQRFLNKAPAAAT